MAREFGTTPPEEIKAALIKNGASPYQSGPIWVWQMLKNIPGSDLLNLLDALWDSAEKQDYLPDIPEAARWKEVARWARDARIAILATLGLEEHS